MATKAQSMPPTAAERVRRLKQQLRLAEPADKTPLARRDTALGRLQGEPRPRRLVDCLTTNGSGGGLIALSLCRDACSRRGELVVVDTERAFYPPAAIAWGVAAHRLIVVTPRTERDAFFSVEAALRSPAVGAVWASLGPIGGVAFRRLLLAAKSGEAFGVLVRPAQLQGEPSWGDTQLCFDPIAEPDEPDSVLRTRVTQTRNRHGPAGGEAIAALDLQTGMIEVTTRHENRPGTNHRRLAAGLADPVAPAPTTRLGSSSGGSV